MGVASAELASRQLTARKVEPAVSARLMTCY
jgi:hypothetical protein